MNLPLQLGNLSLQLLIFRCLFLFPGGEVGADMVEHWVLLYERVCLGRLCELLEVGILLQELLRGKMRIYF